MGITFLKQMTIININKVFGWKFLVFYKKEKGGPKMLNGLLKVTELVKCEKGLE